MSAHTDAEEQNTTEGDTTDGRTIDEVAISGAPAAAAAASAEELPDTPDRAAVGPFDESEVNAVRPYIDLGGVKVLPREGLNLRLEVEEQSKRIVAVGLDYAGSTLQVQPFAAPRSTGLWEETREQIREQVRQQGGRVEERQGPFGPELLAEVPVVAGAEGGAGKRLARFVGVDGPRWFLRGVIGGAGASDVAAAAAVEDLFRSIVVVRGGSPMPPRDLIPLKMPATPGT